MLILANCVILSLLFFVQFGCSLKYNSGSKNTPSIVTFGGNWINDFFCFFAIIPVFCIVQIGFFGYNDLKFIFVLFYYLFRQDFPNLNLHFLLLDQNLLLHSSILHYVYNIVDHYDVNVLVQVFESPTCKHMREIVVFFY